MYIKKIRNYQIFSIIFTFIFGSLLHFTYKLSGENNVVAIFSAINESTWEHLKLIFFPMLFTTIIGYFYLKKDAPNILCAKTIGIVVAMIFLVSFFYTYTGVLGKNFALIDISSFFIATIIGEFISYIYMINKYKCNNIMAVSIILIIFLSFVIFTFKIPNIGIFKDLAKKR